MINSSFNDESSIPINNTDFKDALFMLASLYTQVEFLKTQLDEKDFLIRTLLIREGDV